MSALFCLFLCFRSYPEKLGEYIPTFHKIRYIFWYLYVAVKWIISRLKCKLNAAWGNYYRKSSSFYIPIIYYILVIRKLWFSLICLISQCLCYLTTLLLRLILQARALSKCLKFLCNIILHNHICNTQSRQNWCIVSRTFRRLTKGGLISEGILPLVPLPTKSLSRAENSNFLPSI